MNVHVHVHVVFKLEFGIQYLLSTIIIVKNQFITVKAESFVRNC